jgi:hypothetical protein
MTAKNIPQSYFKSGSGHVVTSVILNHQVGVKNCDNLGEKIKMTF